MLSLSSELQPGRRGGGEGPAEGGRASEWVSECGSEPGEGSDKPARHPSFSHLEASELPHAKLQIRNRQLYNKHD